LALTIKPSPRKPHLSRAVPHRHDQCRGRRRRGTIRREQGRVGDAYSSLGPEKAASVRDFRTLGARVNPRAAGTRTGSCPAHRLGRRQASTLEHPRATARGRPRRPSRRAALLHKQTQAETAAAQAEERDMRRAAGGVVASRAERRTKTLPATETFRTSPSTRHGRGSSLPGRPAPQLPRKEDGLRKNRLYLALVAVRRESGGLAER
jgi:hypothetical protein